MYLEQLSPQVASSLASVSASNISAKERNSINKQQSLIQSTSQKKRIKKKKTSGKQQGKGKLPDEGSKGALIHHSCSYQMVNKLRWDTSEPFQRLSLWQTSRIQKCSWNTYGRCWRKSIIWICNSIVCWKNFLQMRHIPSVTQGDSPSANRDEFILWTSYQKWHALC